MKFTYFSILLASSAGLLLPQTASAEAKDAYYLLLPRTVGPGVPASVRSRLRSTLRSVLSKHNHVIVEGEMDAASMDGPRVDGKALAKRLEAARLAFEELDTEKAIDLVHAVIADVGVFPATPAGRGLWRQAQIRLLAIYDAEQSIVERDKVMHELLRVDPRLNPAAMGVEDHLVDQMIAAKAGLSKSVTLELDVTPADAQVWVDGAPVLSGSQLRPGRHRILVRAPGRSALLADLEVMGGGATSFSARLKSARRPRLKALDEGIVELAPAAKLLGIAGEAGTTAGAKVTLLPTIGRLAEGGFEVRVVAVSQVGALLGVGEAHSEGALGEAEVMLMLRQASGGGRGRAIARSTWQPKVLKKKVVKSPQVRRRPAQARGTGFMPVRGRQRRRPSLLRSPNFWLFTGLVVLGGGAASAVYYLQEPPTTERVGPPQLDASVVIP